MYIKIKKFPVSKKCLVYSTPPIETTLKLYTIQIMLLSLLYKQLQQTKIIKSNSVANKYKIGLHILIPNMTSHKYFVCYNKWSICYFVCQQCAILSTSNSCIYVNSERKHLLKHMTRFTKRGCKILYCDYCLLLTIKKVKLNIYHNIQNVYLKAYAVKIYINFFWIYFIATALFLRKYFY